MPPTDDAYDVSRTLARFVRDVASQEDTEQAVHVVTAQLIEHLPVAAGVGAFLTGPGGSVSSIGPTHEWVQACDRFQHELGEGPCLDSIRHEEVVVSADLRADERWPRWSEPVAQHFGIRSMLSLQLFVHERGVGALNLYSQEVDAFGPVEVLEAGLFAAHAAVLIAGAQQVEQLEVGLGTRTVIGQAEGIVMERFGLDGPQAFSVLTRISQTHNVKIRDVAADIVRTRAIPGTDGGRADEDARPVR